MVMPKDYAKGDSGSDLRLWSRSKCNMMTEMCRAGEEHSDCKIVDMSPCGFGIITNAKLRNGDLWNIFKPWATAEVVWFRDNRAGLKIIN